MRRESIYTGLSSRLRNVNDLARGNILQRLNSRCQYFRDCIPQLFVINIQHQYNLEPVCAM